MKARVLVIKKLLLASIIKLVNFITVSMDQVLEQQTTEVQ